MATQKQDGLFTDTAEAAADLTGKEFYFVKHDADGKAVLCGNDEAPVGIISEGRATGYHVSYNTRGNPFLKALAGTAIARGQDVACGNDGKAKPGSTNPFGVARNACASGEMVEIDTLRTT